MTTQTPEQQQADKSSLETLNKQIQEQFKVDIASVPDNPELKDEQGNVITGETGAELDALLDKTSQEKEPEPSQVTPDETVQLKEKLAATEKKAAAFQSHYQNALKKLEQLNPANYPQIKSEIRQESKPQFQPPAADMVEPDDYLTVSAAKKIFSDVLSDTLNKHQQKSTQDAQLQAVDDYCGQVMADFRQQNNISDEQVNAALREVTVYGIDASTPAGMKGLTRALLDKLTLQAVDSKYDIEVTQAGAEAAAKAKDLKKVQQPSASPLPTPQKTRNQRVLDLMKDPKKEALDEFFGKK